MSNKKQGSTIGSATPFFNGRAGTPTWKILSLGLVAVLMGGGLAWVLQTGSLSNSLNRAELAGELGLPERSLQHPEQQ